MNFETGKYFKTMWPAIIWSVIVFILLIMPPLTKQKENQLDINQLDKAIHFILFATLVFLWGAYLKNSYPETKKFLLMLFVVFLLASCYGILMEYVQLSVGRDFDVWDMIADAAGAFTCWLYYAAKK